MTTESCAAAATYRSHLDAEGGIRDLHHGGFDVKRLSIIGRDQHTDEQVIGYYNAGDRLKYCGTSGAFWGGIWEMLVGSAFLMIPGVGPLVLAGPVVGWIVRALEGGRADGGLSALGSALHGMGIPRECVSRYETVLRDGWYVVIAHGTAVEVSRALEIMTLSHPVALEGFPPMGTGRASFSVSVPGTIPGAAVPRPPGAGPTAGMSSAPGGVGNHPMARQDPAA